MAKRKKKYLGTGWCDICNMEKAQGVIQYNTQAGRIYICRKCRRD